MDGAVGCESRFPTVTVEIRLAAPGDEHLYAATGGVPERVPSVRFEFDLTAGDPNVRDRAST